MGLAPLWIMTKMRETELRLSRSQQGGLTEICGYAKVQRMCGLGAVEVVGQRCGAALIPGPRGNSALRKNASRKFQAVRQATMDGERAPLACRFRRPAENRACSFLGGAWPNGLEDRDSGETPESAHGTRALPGVQYVGIAQFEQDFRGRALALPSANRWPATERRPCLVVADASVLLAAVPGRSPKGDCAAV